MGDIKWIKLSVDLFHNRKIRQLECMTDGDTLVLLWIKLLVLAGRLNDGGLVYITPEVGYDVESLAVELGRPAAVVQRALELFQRFRMVETDENGILFICGWEEHQNVEGMERIREQNRERQKKYYYRQKERATAPIPNVRLTSPHAPEDEREEEEEGEEEKEIHSSIHARGEDSEGSLSDGRRKYLGGALGRGVVLLSDEQMEDLLNRLSLEEFDRYVSIVADNELAGKHYRHKTHYRAILDMAQADRGVCGKGGKHGN